MSRVLLAALAVMAIVPGAPSAAHADDTFEARAAQAVRVRSVDDLVWPLVATCDRGDTVQQRQCRIVRDHKAKALLGATILVDGDPDAFGIGRWNAQKKSIPVSLTACVRCTGVEIEGRTWHVMGSGTPPRIEGGTLRAPSLHDNARMFSDEAAATAWRTSLEVVRVQYLVKVPDKRRWQVSGKDGIHLDIIGFRVISPCDGGVVLAKPPSQSVEADRKACRTTSTKAPPTSSQ